METKLNSLVKLCPPIDCFVVATTECPDNPAGHVYWYGCPPGSHFSRREKKRASSPRLPRIETESASFTSFLNLPIELESLHIKGKTASYSYYQIHLTPSPRSQPSKSRPYQSCKVLTASASFPSIWTPHRSHLQRKNRRNLMAFGQLQNIC